MSAVCASLPNTSLIPPTYCSIVLPALRALHAAYGKISVIHFDAHVDTSDRLKGEPWHGDYFWHAYREGLLTDTSIHAGIRSYWNETADNAVGFTVVTGDEILDIGFKGVIKRIRDRVGDSPVYLTIDIDTLDPAFAVGGPGRSFVGRMFSLNPHSLLLALPNLEAGPRGR